MENVDFFNYNSKLILKSMLYEVAAAPKPGLVDRYNSGSHMDMDIFSFIDSAVELQNYYYQCTKIGYEVGNHNLLEKLRPIGIDAERQMFIATKGVNTHKGLIFSLGIIAAVAGKLYNEKKTFYLNSKEISESTMKISSDITNQLQQNKSTDKLTYGERIYQMYGLTGIRGEVESGFKTVINISLPILKDLINENKHHINDIMVHCLLFIMADLDDTNILGRHGLEALEYVKREAKKAIDLGGYLTDKGMRSVKDMDKNFIGHNISPGGAADLLAITLLIYFLENGDRLL